MQVLKKEQQLKDVVVESYCICDKCDERIKKDHFDAFEFELELEHKTGKIYGGDGGSVKTESIDLCQKCSVELIGMLKEKGYRFNSVECDW